MRQLIEALKALILALLWATLSPLPAAAQATNDWNANVPAAYGRMVARDAANNVIAVGTDPTTGTVLTQKYSPTGTLLWQRVFDNPLTRELGTWVETDAAGNAWVVGSLATAGSGSTSGILVLKYDPAGTLLFQDVIANAFGYGLRVVINSAGEAYVLGRLWVANASGNTTHDIATIKYSASGVRQWGRYFGFDATSADSPAAIKLLPSGNVLVGGSAGGKMLLVAYDPAGNQVWSKSVPLSTGTTDVAVGPGGEFYAIGGTYSPATGNTAFVIKHDANFNELWRRTYANATYGTNAAVDSLGQLVVAGIINPNGGYMDWVTFKLDAAGGMLWSRGLNLHLYNDEFPSAMVVGPDNSVYITGQGGPGPDTGNVSYLRAVTAKYSANGVPAWIHTTFDTVRGLGLALGSDQSLAVVGESPMRVMHYMPGSGIGFGTSVSASADKNSGPAPLVVTFTPFVVEGFGLSLQWDFGDGRGSTLGTSVPHTYQPGSWQATLHGVLNSGFVLSSAPVSITAGAAVPVPTALTLASSTIVGGKSTQGTVTVSGNAGAVVALSSSNGALVKLPASVQIAAGATSATFRISTSRVRVATPVTITATANGRSVSATLTLTR